MERAEHFGSAIFYFRVEAIQPSSRTIRTVLTGIAWWKACTAEISLQFHIKLLFVILPSMCYVKFSITEK
jgi:hypothetical protein